jgi:hypothetical protein
MLARRWATVLALFGAASVVLAYFVTVSGEELPLLGGFDETPSQWDWALEALDPYHDLGVWFVWSPIEAFGVALLVVAVVLSPILLPVVARAAVNGMLIGVGLLTVVASLALLSVYDIGAAFLLTSLGGLAILGAGVLGTATDRPFPRFNESPPRWTVLAAGVGAALLLMSLFLDMASPTSATGITDDDLLGQLSAKGYAFWVELAFAAGLAVVAGALVYRSPPIRLVAGGFLIAVGLQAALHLSGLLFQLGKFDRNVEHAWRFGGAAGLLGCLLVLAAGSGVVWAGSRPKRLT